MVWNREARDQQRDEGRRENDLPRDGNQLNDEDDEITTGIVSTTITPTMGAIGVTTTTTTASREGRTKGLPLWKVVYWYPNFMGTEGSMRANKWL